MTAAMKDHIVLFLAFGVITIYADAYPPPLPDQHSTLPIDTFGCEAPDCHTSHGYHILWPHQNPQHFYQCEPNYNAVIHSCPEGTKFGYFHQVCVHNSKWNTNGDHCDSLITTNAVEETTAQPSVTQWVAQQMTTTNSIILPLSSYFNCEEPDCSLPVGQQKLWPHQKPENFYQCTPSGRPLVHKCAAGTLFGFFHQVCIHKIMWDEDRDHCISDLTTTHSLATTTPDTESSALPTTNATTATSTTAQSTTNSNDANDSSADLEFFNCEEPDCSLPIAQHKLWSHENPGKFYECSSCGTVIHKCDTGTLFSFFNQRCVSPCIWNIDRDHCRSDSCVLKLKYNI